MRSRSPSRSRSPPPPRSPSRSRSRSRSQADNGVDMDRDAAGSPQVRRRSVSRSRSRSPSNRSRSRSRSPRPRYQRSRSLSRSRSRDRYARNRSRSRSYGRRASPAYNNNNNNRGRYYSRSPGRRRSPRPGINEYKGLNWKKKLDRLVDDGYMRPNDIDSYTMGQVEILSDDMAENVVQRFCEANFARIGNKSGFLMGIIRRIQQDGPDLGRGDVDSLPRSVRYRLKDLVEDGYLRRGDLDSRLCNALGDLQTDLGLEALDKFSRANLSHVRSKTGFLLGIIKRIQQDNKRYNYRY